MKQKVVRGVVTFLCVAVLFAGMTIRSVAVDSVSWDEVTNTIKDLNGDGKVSDEDLDVLRLALLGGDTTDKYDVNGNGRVDICDIVRLKKVVDELNQSDKLISGEHNTENRWGEVY